MTSSHDSLLRCTVKKSYSVAKHIAVTLLKAATVIGAVAATGCIAILSIPPIVGALSAPLSDLLSALAAVPLWVWAALAVPTAIILYSFLWCVKRDLTEEDWDSDAAQGSSNIMCLVLVGISVGIGALIGYMLLPDPPEAKLAFGGFVGFVSLIPIVTLTPEPWLDAFAYFPGAAWHHYRHRKDGEK